MARHKPQVLPTDRLDVMLTRLQLTGIRDQLDTLLDEAARADLSARETLALLSEREIARKDQRRIEMALKLAHYPCVRDLAGFDFAAQPSVDAKQIRDLAAARWVANGENLLLLGPPGVGKTHLAIALGERHMRCGANGFVIMFLSTLPRGERPEALVASFAGRCFYPRSRTGSDAIWHSRTACTGMFLSTLPRGERRFADRL